MKRIKLFFKKYIPLPALICFLLAALCGVCHLFAVLNEGFAEWLSSTVGYAFRRALSWLSGLLPFSVAECLIILSPLIIALVIVFAVRGRGGEGKVRFLAGVLAVLSLFYSSYAMTLGVGYHRDSLNERMSIEKTAVTAENLYDTLIILKKKCAELSEELSLSEGGSSVMPLEFGEVSRQVVIGYERLSEEYPELNIKNFDSRAKAVLLSKPMSKLELLGVYTFFTGESNVNVYYPDYTVPFTVAHELAHQRGIARENEANFLAFAVCIRADDPYVRYSGYMNMFEYVASALSKTDKKLLRSAYEGLHPNMLSEMRAYSAFYKENKNEFWGTVSDTVNDTYLKAQGTEGIISYGLVVELCVAYYAE